MKNCPSLSIRTQMIILTLVMSLAPLGIIIFSSVQRHSIDKQSAWLTAERLSNEIGNQQNVLLSGAEQLLSSLEYIPSIQNRDAKAATSLFVKLAKKYPEITNILIADTTGLVWASALPMRGATMANDRRFFKNALATGKFSSGEYTIGRVLNKPALSFGYPIREPSGKIRDIAIVAFTLDSYNLLLKKKKMPDKTSLVLTDHNGVILFDATTPQFIGKEDKKDIFKLMSEGSDKGNFEAIGITGKNRYFAYQKIRLNNEQTPYMYVRTGILKQALLSDNLLLQAGVMGLFTLLAVCLGVYAGKRCILDKIYAIRDAVQQVGMGNLDIRVSDNVFGGELGELGCKFDEMSQRLAEDSIKRKLIEESLLESEAKYRILVETANEGIWVADKGYRTTFVNNKIAEILGYLPDEMLGRSVGSFIATEDAQNFKEQMNLINHGECSRFERRFLRRDGIIIWALVSAAPLKDFQGNFIGSFAMISDISDRKQFEDALGESSANLSATLNATADGILAVGATGKVLFANKRFSDLWNIPQSILETGDDNTFIGHILAQMSNPDDFLVEVKRIYDSNESRSDTIQFKDGRIFERYSFPLGNEKSASTGRVWSFRDISERVSIEKDLAILVQEVETRNTFVESVIANIQSGIIVVDQNFRIKMANNYVAEITRMPIDRIVRRDLVEIIPELHEEIHAGKTTDEFIAYFSSLQKTIGYNCFDLPDANGNVVGYIINFKDLTEIVRIRKELRLKERLSSMGEVVARVAHEMRNPLFGMTAAAQILEMELILEPNQKELMDSLLKESHRLNNLVEELLDTTRETRIKKKKFDLISLLEESLLVVEPLFYEKMVSLRKNYDGEVLVSADSEKMEQVIINLVKNALEASGPGGWISIDVVSFDSYVSVIVTDNGEGISPENMDRIFDVFYTTKKNGTGMGLSICRGIVEAHEGTLTASNNQDGGARFVIKLPCGECWL